MRGHRTPTTTGTADGRTARDRGISLIEILVSTVLLGMVGVAVLAAFAAATRGSALSVQIADQQSRLVSSHDALANQAGYVDCTAGDPAGTYAT